MKVAVIGAGFTGLAAASKLSQLGHNVILLEKNPYPGGLAAGFSTAEWQWSLEHHYHHIFKKDHAIIDFFTQHKLAHLLTFSSTSTAVIHQKHIYPFDNALDILKVPYLSPVDKIRLGLTIVLLKISPRWQELDRLTAKQFIITTMGEKCWNTIWKPLFVGKFAASVDQINAAWFWARIHARTKQLGYIKGGFANGATKIVESLKRQGVAVKLATPVSQIISTQNQLKVITADAKYSVDQVLVTGPAPVLTSIAPKLPTTFTKTIQKLKYTGAVTLVTESTQSCMQDNTYWLNVSDDSPMLAIVEHTNFVKKTHYNNKHITYVGKYTSDPDWLNSSNQQLIRKYKPFLDQLNPQFTASITRSWAFSSPFAQPIVKPGHAKKVPPNTTPIKNLYWASIQHVYPWDRGTNYAVKLGLEVAQKMHQHQ